MPSDETFGTFVVQAVRAMKIITLALFNGCVLFGVIACFMVQQNAGRANAAPELVYLAAGFTLLALLLSAAWPFMTQKRQLRGLADGTWPRPGGQLPALFKNPIQADVLILLGLYQSQRVMRMALIEGAAFFNGIAFLISGNWLSLGLMAVCALLILLHFPTVGRVRIWLENRLQELELMRAQS